MPYCITHLNGVIFQNQEHDWVMIQPNVKWKISFFFFCIEMLFFWHLSMLISIYMNAMQIILILLL